MLLATICESRKFNELAYPCNRVNVDVVNSRISGSNPTVDAMISIEHALYAFIFCNDDRAAEVLACDVNVVAAFDPNQQRPRVNRRG